MPKFKKVIYENKIIDSCGKCLECDAPTIYRGMRVCDMDQLIEGGGTKQPICECINCLTRFIIEED